MIVVSVNKDKDVISSVKISGHALYDDYGKDIVCASVSSIVICTINAMSRINSHAISYDTKSGVNLIIKEKDEVIMKLLDNMIDLLRELSDDYPDNIKIK